MLNRTIDPQTTPLPVRKRHVVMWWEPTIPEQASAVMDWVRANDSTPTVLDNGVLLIVARTGRSITMHIHVRPGEALLRSDGRWSPLTAKEFNDRWEVAP